MSKKKKLIPGLRFPEFENEGEWEEKSLNKVVTDFIVPMRDKPKDLSGNVPWCRIEDFNGMYLSGSKSNQGVSIETIKEMNLKVYPINTLLVSCSADLGRCAITQKPLVTNQTFIGLVPDVKKVNTVYLYYVMTNSSKELNARSSGTTISYLSRQQFEKFEIWLPNTKEQQKIASCLSSLDDLIEAHSKKIILLNDHKKGLMQNFFPQEGEKAPKVRFSEFKNDGNWIKETVGDVYDFKVTNSFAREYLNYEDGSVKNIHYGDIHTKFNTLFDITKENVPFINPDITIEKIRKESYCIAGDMIFADASEDMNDVGKSIEIVNLNKENLVSGLHTLLARQRGKKLAIGFGGYLFKSDWIRKQIQREAQGAKVLGISATRISNVQILYPKNHKEQQKISSCLSSLDALIKAQAEKIEQLKKHKKGLMQGLFPKMID